MIEAEFAWVLLVVRMAVSKVDSGTGDRGRVCMGFIGGEDGTRQSA